MVGLTTILRHLPFPNIYNIIEVKTLAPATSQHTEPTTMIRSLILAKDPYINIYRDSKYTYNIIFSKIFLWKEMGFLISNQFIYITINNTTLIYNFLEAVLLLYQAVIIHCWGYNKDKQHISVSNHYASLLAKDIALTHPSLTKSLPKIISNYQYQLTSHPGPSSSIKDILPHLHSLLHSYAQLLLTFVKTTYQYNPQTSNFDNSSLILVPPSHN